MLRLMKKAVNRSSDLVKNRYEQSKGPKNNLSPISNRRSFSCEDLLLVGSLSQIKRQRGSTSVHTISSTSDDQLSRTLSGSIEDVDNDDICSLPVDHDNSVVHNHIIKPTLRPKVSRKGSDNFRYQNALGWRLSGEVGSLPVLDDFECQKVEEAYEEALKYGAVDVTYVRLMLIGLPEAGKTTTRFSLMGEKSPNNLSRTKLVEPCQKPIRRQFAVTGKHGWSYINHEQEDEDLAVLLNRLMNNNENEASKFSVENCNSDPTSASVCNLCPISSLPVTLPSRSASISPVNSLPLPPKRINNTIPYSGANKAITFTRQAAQSVSMEEIYEDPADVISASGIKASISSIGSSVQSDTSTFENSLTQSKNEVISTTRSNSTNSHLITPASACLRARFQSLSLCKSETLNRCTKSSDPMSHRKPKVSETSWNQDQFLQQGSKFRQKIKESVFNKLKGQGENVSTAAGFDNEVLINIWDCGGQFVFREILPAFLAQKVAYLLIYDASKNLEKVYQEPGTNLGCYAEGNTFHHMQKWMAAIHAHSTLLLPSASLYPRMLIIGTHGDALKTGEGTYEAAKENIISKIKSHFKGKRFADLVLAHFIVDNTTGGEGSNEDPSFEMIRCQVEDYAKQSLTISTPVSWVLFRRVFQATITEAGISIVSISVAKEIAAECKIDEDTLSQVLVFYHQVGLLLHYASVPILDEVVIADPQWLVNSLSLLFTLRTCEHEELASLWILLHEKGVLEKALYESIWCDCGIDPQGLLNLLEYFLLAAPIKPAVKQQFSDCAYFVPSLLSSWASEEDCSNLEEAVQTAAPLFLVFNTEYVPPGFFIRLAASFSSVDGVDIIFDSGVYRNRITFSIGEADELTMVENLESIKITLARYFSYKDTSFSFSEACLNAKNSLLACCLTITQQWMPAVKTTTAFQCTKFQCSNKQPHYIHFDNTIRSCLKCSYSKVREEPSEVQKLWLQPTISGLDMKDEVQTMKLFSKLVLKLNANKLELLACHLGVYSYDAMKVDYPRHLERSMAVLKEWYDIGKGSLNDLLQALKETGHSQAAKLVPTKQDYNNLYSLNLHSSCNQGPLSTCFPYRQPSFRKPKASITKELTLQRIVQISSRIKDESKVIVLAVLLGYSEQEFFDMRCDYHTTHLLALHMITKWWKSSDGSLNDLTEFLKAAGLVDSL